MNPSLPAPLVAVVRSSAVVVLTGAGVSAASAILTFRDALDGLWAKYDPKQRRRAPAGFDAGRA